MIELSIILLWFVTGFAAHVVAVKIALKTDFMLSDVFIGLLFSVIGPLMFIPVGLLLCERYPGRKLF